MTSAVFGLVGVVVGVTGTWLISLSTNRTQRANSREERRAETYVHAVRYANYAASWASQFGAAAARISLPVDYQAADIEGSDELFARLVAFGSDQVVRLYTDLSKSMSQFMALIDSYLSTDGSEHAEAYEALMRQVKEAADASQALRNRVRTELGGVALPVIEMPASLLKMPPHTHKQLADEELLSDEERVPGCDS